VSKPKSREHLLNRSQVSEAEETEDAVCRGSLYSELFARKIMSVRESSVPVMQSVTASMVRP